MKKEINKNIVGKDNFQKRKNSAGFTLVELLSVLVVLIAIMSLSIVSVSSALENTSSSEDERMKTTWILAAELYVTDNKEAIYTKMDNYSNTSCYVSLSSLVSNGYLTNSQITNSNGNKQSGYIIFSKSITYTYSTSISGYKSCYK